MYHKVNIFSYFSLLIILFSVTIFVITCQKKEVKKTIISGIDPEGQILDFKLNDQSIPIDQKNKKISTEMTQAEFGSGIFMLNMKLSINTDNVTPENNQEIILFIQNKKAIQNFIVKGSNGELITYVLTIYIVTGEPQITKFKVENIEGTINHAQKTIDLALMPTQFNQGNFTSPNIEISRGSEILNSDLSKPFIISQNVSKKSYTVFLTDNPEITSTYQVNIYETTCEIYTEEDLRNKLTTFSTDKNAYCVLRNDIYLTKDWVPIVNFHGIFDGQDFTIHNLTINRPNENEIGFFKELNAKEIKNIKFKNVNIKGKDNVGTLSGQVREGIILNRVRVQGFIEGNNYVGGLVNMMNPNSPARKNIEVFYSSFSGKIETKLATNANSSALIGLSTKQLYLSNNKFNILVKESYFDGILAGSALSGLTAENNLSTQLINTYSKGQALSESSNSITFNSNQVDFTYSTMSFPDGNYYLGDEIKNSQNNSLFVPMPKAGITLYTPSPPYKAPTPLTLDQVKDTNTFINKGFSPKIWDFYTDGRWPTLINTPEDW